MSRFKNINELKAGSIITYINLIISTIIPLLYTPIMLRMLGKAEYGLYGIANSVIGYLTLLNFGLGSAVNRYVIKFKVEDDKDKMQKMIGLFITIYSILACAVIIGGFAMTGGAGIFFGNSLSQYEIDKLKILMIIMSISTAVSFPTSVFSAVIVSYEKYIFRKIMDSLITVITPILNLCVLYMGMASVGMAMVSLAIQILYAVVMCFYCLKKLYVKPDFKELPFYMLKEIGTFSAFVFLSTIIDMLYWATDKVLIGSMIGTTAVAVYNIGGTFVSMLQNMSSAISGVFGTRVNSMVFKNQSMSEISDLLVRVGRLQFIIVSLILSGYITFGKVFIQFWAGSDYIESYYIGLMTIIPLAVPLIQNIAYTTIVAMNKHRFRAIVYAVIAVINVTATWLCIPRFGIVGAAACTAVAFVLGNGIIMNIYYSRMGLDIIRFWKNIIKMSIVPVGMSIVSYFIFKKIIIINSLIMMLILAGVYTIIFIVLMWFFSMNTYEKEIFKSLIFKIVRIKNK